MYLLQKNKKKSFYQFLFCILPVSENKLLVGEKSEQNQGMFCLPMSGNLVLDFARSHESVV